MDKLILSDNLAAPFSAGAVLDGGDDTDTVVFGPNIMSLNIAAVMLHGADDFSLTIDAPLTTYSMRLANWEFFEFSDGIFAASELTATPVPLPAPFLLWALLC